MTSAPLSFKKRFWQLSRWLGGIFILFFSLRFAYGFLVVNNGLGGNFGNDFFSSLENIRKNYASEKIALKNEYKQQYDVSSNQKFEKTASIKIKSAEFDKDEKAIKTKTKAFQGIIQYEQNLGQKGNRQIHLLIGVNPNLFDSFYRDIQKIGLVLTTQVTKVDKTNEYRQLNAKKASLEKTLQSLLDLKTRTGQITDFVSLHDKILEIESKLQELGVELGNFDVENEFCTVKISLYEGAVEKSISVFQRLKVALEWTIKYYAVFIFTLFGLSVTVFVLLLIIDRLKLLSTINNKINE